MKKVQPEEGESADIVSENIERLKELFPDAFSEGGVDFDALRQLLGDANVLDEGEEKYGLNWHGKKKARQIALTPSTGTLLPCPEESVEWDTTKNLFIEGDNLEVLKLLQKSYANKVKMIYIDPPYNTGKEFIYPDKFQENLDTYLKYTGQVDDEGMKISSNTESTGRFHTNWLNMMYPRIKLAKNLLKPDGVLFISIDDGEHSNLRKICDEIFGEGNLIANAIWRSKDNSNNDAKRFSTDHNHILIYARSAEWQPARLFDEAKQSHFKNPDDDPRGPYFDGNPLNSPNYRENLIYDLVSPSGNVIKPPKNGWRWSESVMQEKISSGEIKFTEDEKNIRRRTYLADAKGLPPSSLWIDLEKTGHNRQAKYEILKLFGAEVFDTPKPTRLIEFMMNLAGCEDGDILFDFFAGSAASANAVLNFNRQNDKSVRFIMCQLPEAVDEKAEAFEAGFRTVSQIGMERIRRARKKIIEEDGSCKKDSGFRLFKLSSSNIQIWNPDQSDLEESLLSYQEHLIDGRTEQDILYELLLKRGVDLAVPIESREVVGKSVYSIAYGVLFACFDESITKDQVEEIGQAIVDWHQELAPSSDTHVFFRDSAFSDDVSKTNMAAILEQNGINHVRSL